METDPRTTPADLAEFNEFYSTTHVREVVAAHQGFVRAHRYELVDGDSVERVGWGPRWLAIYEMTDEAAAEQYIKDNARPWLHRRQYSPWPKARKRAKIVWRMLWRQVSGTGSSDEPAELVSIVGADAPPRIDAARASGLEMYRAFAPADSSCPRYCAVVEGGLGSGPRPEPIWNLLYRRIPLP